MFVVGGCDLIDESEANAIARPIGAALNRDISQGEKVDAADTR
jgi:hypothetical protein